LLAKQEIIAFIDQFQQSAGGYSLISRKDKARLDQIFKLADLNRDRKLSKFEIRTLAKNLGEKIDEKDMELGFRLIDTNRDG
jgi:Ca2+-binding EF-hand superfamily protein